MSDAWQDDVIACALLRRSEVGSFVGRTRLEDEARGRAPGTTATPLGSLRRVARRLAAGRASRTRVLKVRRSLGQGASGESGTRTPRDGLFSMPVIAGLARGKPEAYISPPRDEKPRSASVPEDSGCRNAYRGEVPRPPQNLKKIRLGACVGRSGGLNSLSFLVLQRCDAEPAL